jgi:hypothetical protein
MFNRRAFLGQVPLVLGPSSWGQGMVLPAPPSPPPPPSPASSLEEDEEIPANGGKIVKKIGFLWFFPDADTKQMIEEALGESIDESIEARVRFCNKTPGIVAVLGDFIDPDTGLVCFVDLPEAWNKAWRGW